MNQRFHALLAASSLVAALAVGACGGDSSSGGTTTSGPGSTGGGGMGGGGAGGGAPDCFTNPKTHVEIINACTDADKIDKTSNLPLLGPKGELPPLP